MKAFFVCYLASMFLWLLEVVEYSSKQISFETATLAMILPILFMLLGVAFAIDEKK